MPRMHEVDYKICGDDMQFVEIELDPGEAVVAEAGSMMYMQDGIDMDTIFGETATRNRASWARSWARASASSPANPCS